MIEISLNKIKKNYGFSKLLNDFDMVIKTGEKVALIGPNGCGKTTVFKMIIKEELPDVGTISIRKDSKIGYLKQIPPLLDNDVTGNDVFLKGAKELLDMKKLIDEYNLTSNNKNIKKYTSLMEKFEIMGGYSLNEKINKIKNGLKLSDDVLSTKYNNLSGGEKTLINLASLMLEGPEILLLDEPTNHLDIETLQWFEEYLKNYKGTVLIISHDRYFLDKVVNKIVAIELSTSNVYHGNYSYYLVESEKNILLEFKKYKNQQKEIKAIRDAIDRYRTWGEKSDNPIFFRRMHALEKRLEKMSIIDKPIEKKNLNISFNLSNRNSNHVLVIKNYDLYIENKLLIKNINMDICYQDRVCLLGNNGTGKTTLIKKIIDNNNQSITLSESNVIGFIEQEIRFSDENLTLYDYVRSFFVGTESELRSKLFQFYFGEEQLSKKLKNLSGGEKVRIKLLELIIKNINLLILDEPTNHIDIDTREILEKALLDFKGTIIFISHDRYFIKKIATKILKIDNNSIKQYSQYEEIVNNVATVDVPKVEEKIEINASNRINEFIKDSIINEVTIGCSNTKVYKIRKKSKVFYLKIANHLSIESMKLDYLSDKILVPKKMFYEKYNGKSYILTRSLEGEMLCSDYYINNPLEGIKIIVQAFNNLYNIDYVDCLFDETVDAKIKRIEDSFIDEDVTDERFSNRFKTKSMMLNYIKGNKPKSIIGFTHGDMSLPNIFGKDSHFTGLLDVDECGISDIYFDIVVCEISIERNYGKEYVDVFYREMGIEKDEFKSDYYRIMLYL